MHTHNHERPAMAREYFPDLPEANRNKRPASQDAPHPHPLDERTAGAHSPLPPPVSAAAHLPAGRCRVKGCIYPATEVQTGMCLCHCHQEEEPQFFESRQPSLRLQEAAIYGVSTEDEDLRIRQRRERTALRQAFLKGVA